MAAYVAKFYSVKMIKKQHQFHGLSSFTSIDYDKYFVYVQVKLKNDGNFVMFVSDRIKTFVIWFPSTIYTMTRRWTKFVFITYISKSDYIRIHLLIFILSRHTIRCNNSHCNKRLSIVYQNLIWIVDLYISLLGVLCWIT